MAEEAAAAAANVEAELKPVEKPDFEAFNAKVNALNAEIEALKAKRERAQAKLSGSKGSNDELNVRAGCRWNESRCCERVWGKSALALVGCRVMGDRPVHFISKC